MNLTHYRMHVLDYLLDYANRESKKQTRGIPNSSTTQWQIHGWSYEFQGMVKVIPVKKLSLLDFLYFSCDLHISIQQRQYIRIDFTGSLAYRLSNILNAGFSGSYLCLNDYSLPAAIMNPYLMSLSSKIKS